MLTAGYYSEELMPILVILIIFGMPIFIVYILQYFKGKNNAERNAILLEIAKNDNISVEDRQIMFDNLDKLYNNKKKSNGNNGVLTMSVGVGFIFMGIILEQSIFTGGVGIGVFIFFVGLGLFLKNKYFFEENNSQEKDNMEGKTTTNIDA